MAIVWSGSSFHMSVGVNLFYTGSPSDGSLWCAADIYLRSDSWGFGSQSSPNAIPVSWWGFGGTGSITASFWSAYSETKQVLVKQVRWTEPLNYGSQKEVAVGVGFGPNYGGGQAAVQASMWLPARPYAAPAAPTNVVASRVSATQANLSWSISSTTAAPVLKQGVERFSWARQVWERVATLGGSTRSWSDTSLPANDTFKYRVWGESSIAGPKSTSGYVVSTIAAPTGVSAVKNTDSSITVSWSKAYSGWGQFTIFDNGVQVGTVEASTGLQYSFTHAQPNPQVTHTYTIVQSEEGVSSPASAPSNTIQLLAAPNAPKLTGPTGVKLAGSILFTWQHNPVDSSAQTAANMRYRLAGAPSWTTITATTAQSLTRTLTPGSYEWQVRTKGLHADYSPWSPVGVFTVADAPGVSITQPADSSTLGTSRVTATWTYYQAQNSGQAAAEVQLYQGDQVIEQGTVIGEATVFAFQTALVDSGSYQVRVRVRSGHGLWSEWVVAAFNTAFPLPPAPTVEAVWDEKLGMTIVAVTNMQAAEGQPNAVYNRVERSINGGETWELIVSGLVVSGSVIDSECLSNGTTSYRVTAVSELPSMASTTVEVEADSGAIWINSGIGLHGAVKLRHKARIQATSGLTHQVAHMFQGRTRPVFFDGPMTSRAFEITATVFPARAAATLEESSEQMLGHLDKLATTTGKKLLRDPYGRRIYGRVTQVQTSPAEDGVASVQVTFQEGD